MCWLVLEDEGCMLYLLYPLIICPILDILLFPVPGQQLGLLIRGVNRLETLGQKCSLESGSRIAIGCHIQPCPTLGLYLG